MRITPQKKLDSLFIILQKNIKLFKYAKRIQL